MFGFGANETGKLNPVSGGDGVEMVGMERLVIGFFLFDKF